MLFSAFHIIVKKNITMSSLFKIVLSICLISCVFSCHEDEVLNSTPDCTIKAFYKGTNVCHNGENAAAIQVEFNDRYLILPNFLELVDEDAISYDDVLYVEYEAVDFDDISPALCGALIVAPVTNLTCVTLE